MTDLTTGSVTRHLVHMSAFLAMSMAVQTLYLLADLYWVGHLGKEAIAAVGVAGNITMIVLALTQMLGVGTTTLIAQAAGRKDQVRAELVFYQSFVMSIVIAFALGIVGFLLRPAYCDWLSADAATATLAKAYLLWFLPGLLLQFPLVALGSALRATGIIKPAVGFQVLSVLLNIVLAPLLIFGIGPWPKLGVTGAALTTFISILVADVLMVIYFEKKYHYCVSDSRFLDRRQKFGRGCCASVCRPALSLCCSLFTSCLFTQSSAALDQQLRRASESARA